MSIAAPPPRQYHYEVTANVPSDPERVFARLDDQKRLAEHMSRPSLMTGGGRMAYVFDAGAGQVVGSRFQMSGRAFGLWLSVDQVVTERNPPRRKSWRTTGEPKLLIIGKYQMGFEVAPAAKGSTLRVWIDYDPPSLRWPGVKLLTKAYARWCVDQMAKDAVRATGGPDAPRR